MNDRLAVRIHAGAQVAHAGNRPAALVLLAIVGAALWSCSGGAAATADGDPGDAGDRARDAALADGVRDASRVDAVADVEPVGDLAVDAGQRDPEDTGMSPPDGRPPIDRIIHLETAQATFALG